METQAQSKSGFSLSNLFPQEVISKLELQPMQLSSETLGQECSVKLQSSYTSPT
jgi:hypothetical protein